MWRNLFRSFKFGAKKSNKEEDIKIEEIVPNFDEKYKIIIKYKYDENIDMGIINWLNDNTVGAVDINFSQTSNWCYYIAFEDLDDALVFKIKYL